MNYNNPGNRLVVLCFFFVLNRHLVEGTEFYADKKPKCDFHRESISVVRISASYKFNPDNFFGEYLNSSVNKNTENFVVSRRSRHPARWVLHFASVSDYPDSE